MNLDNKYLGKAIDDQSRQEVPFSIYQAIGVSFIGIKYLSQ